MQFLQIVTLERCKVWLKQILGPLAQMQFERESRLIQRKSRPVGRRPARSWLLTSVAFVSESRLACFNEEYTFAYCCDAFFDASWHGEVVRRLAALERILSGREFADCTHAGIGTWQCIADASSAQGADLSSVPPASELAGRGDCWGLGGDYGYDQ